MIAAVSGTPDEFIPFTVTEATLLSDTIRFFDGSTADTSFETFPIAKFLKENRKELVDIPVTFPTESKSKNTKALSLPLILPLLKVFMIPEAPLDSDEVTNENPILDE